MTPRERVRAALAGEALDRVPVSLWHHFPGRDQTAQLLAEATVEFVERYPVDVVKLMPTGMYSVVDYGVEIRPSDDALGTTVFARGPVKAPDDWRRLPQVSAERGTLAEQVELVRLVRARLGPEIPIVQTLFSPLTMVAKIAGGALADPFGGDAALAARVLTGLADDVVAFGRACLAAGADGFYFATQLANRDTPAATYERLGVPFDLRVLDALRPGSWLLMLHLHGPEPRFGLADRYPVDVASWEDRETPPSLAEARARTGRVLMAGLSRDQLFMEDRQAEVTAQVRDALAQTGGRGIIVAPGCVLPTSASPASLDAVLTAIGVPEVPTT